MIEKEQETGRNLTLSWLPLAFLFVSFAASLFAATDAPSIGDERDSVRKEAPTRALETKIEYTRKVEGELDGWRRKIEELKTRAVGAPKVGGRQRHLRDTARFLESKSREVASDLTELRTANVKFWEGIQSKIDVKLNEMRTTYEAIAAE